MSFSAEESRRLATERIVAQFEAAVEKQRAAIDNRIRRIREAKQRTGKAALSSAELDAIGIESSSRRRPK